jgi:hypothetical protein
MAALTPQQIVTTGNGVKPIYGTANSGGDTLAQESKARRFVHYKNGSGGTLTITVAKQVSTLPVSGYGSVAISDITCAIPAGEERMLGPFSDAYKDGNGNINFTYSGVTSLTVAAIELPAL